MNQVSVPDIKHFEIGTMRVEVHPSRKAMGSAAASAAAQRLRALGRTRETIAVIFATGASQLDTLEALTRMDDLPWRRIHGFHMDEYIGLPLDHAASFRHYLRERLSQNVQMKEFSEVDGTAPDPERVALDYGKQLRSADPQLCLLGIGENGHLAFNDPAVADFNDAVDAKVVRLDAVCRQQQVAEGWFDALEDVPDSAITLTIPAILRVPTLIVSVPGNRKAKIMRRTLEETISTDCPATVLRQHQDVTVYLDSDSAAELGALIPI